ncbi:MAG: PqqD family peptide modification chaperone [Gammaproteobacteria bacterium]|nr:PqqD family peptide modification chaperone [Gammaproteobacteria bacterium]
MICRNESILFSELEDKLLMMSIDNGEYYSLDSIAARIWELIETPKSVEQLCSILVKEYDVASDTCEEDVVDFIEKMQSLGIISTQTS